MVSFKEAGLGTKSATMLRFDADALFMSASSEALKERPLVLVFYRGDW